MRGIGRTLLSVAVAWSMDAGAQVVRGPMPPPYVPPPVTMPLLPSPMAVTVRTAPASVTPSVTMTTPPPLSIRPSVATAETVSEVTTAPSPAVDDGAMTATTGEMPAPQVPVQTVTIAPPPPTEADEGPDPECHVDDDNNVMTPVKDCTDVGATETGQAPAESTSPGISGWWIALVVALAALLLGWIRSMRRR
jgi:hypothetical protein